MRKHNIIDRNGYLKDFSSNNKEGFENSEGIVNLIACGDLGPVRNLQNIVCKNGPAYVIGDLNTVLNQADVVFANLEATFSNRGKPLNRVPVFRLNPNSFSIVKKAGVNVVSLANNHMFDYGPEAFFDTVSLLDTNDIVHFGAGLTFEQAMKPAKLTVKGVRFGFLGFRDKEHKNFDNNGVITPQIYYDIVAKNIQKLRPEVDFLILSLHFGWEYQFYPSPKDVKLCRSFIDKGADIILGHHPHYPQGVEKYKSGLIAYSLGNFIWDQNFVGNTKASYLLEILVDKHEIKSTKVIPFKLNRNYCLEISSDKQAYVQLSELSRVLSLKESLEKQWYFTCRNKLIELFMNLRDIFFKRRLRPYYIALWFRGIFFNPRARYTWMSLFHFLLTGKAFKYEFKKRFRS